MHSSPANSQAPGRCRPGRRRPGTGLVAATRVPAGAAGPAVTPAPIASPAAPTQVITVSETATGTGIATSAFTALTAGSLGPSPQATEIGNEPDRFSQYSNNTAQYSTVTNPDWANVRGYAAGQPGGPMTVAAGGAALSTLTP
jgi:hypothetical protein